MLLFSFLSSFSLSFFSFVTSLVFSPFTHFSFSSALSYLSAIFFFLLSLYLASFHFPRFSLIFLHTIYISSLSFPYLSSLPSFVLLTRPCIFSRFPLFCIHISLLFFISFTFLFFFLLIFSYPQPFVSLATISQFCL